MKSPLLDAMRQATQAVRDGNPMAATEAIQQALSGNPGFATPKSADDFDGVTIEGRSDHTGPDRAAPPRPDPGATLPMLSQTYRGAAGSRDYKLFVPPQAPDGVRGLIVMLHGCTQNADDFARGTAMNAIAAREGLVIAYPNQPPSNNPNGCWNWYEPLNQRAGAGEPAIIAGLTEEIVQTHRVPRGAVFAAGLSAGGAMAAIMGDAYPDVFGAVGVHSGLAAGCAKDIPSAFAAMNGSGAGEGFPVAPGGKHARVMVVHGSQDRTVVSANGAKVFDRMKIAFPKAVVKRDSGNNKGTVRLRLVTPDGTVVAEHWEIAALAHAWSGGSSAGSFTAPRSPDASEGFVRFFLDPKA